jgi:phage tail sheath protein FI
MTTVSYPGVYVEEIPGGAKPIEAASTSTAAFAGESEKGPSDKAKRLTSWEEYQKYYGNFITGSSLAESVFQYFNNGGRQCYISRVLRTGAQTASVSVNNRASTPIADAVTFKAKNEGEWGNFIYMTIEASTSEPGNRFKVSVRRQSLAGVIPTGSEVPDPLELFDNLSMDPGSTDFCETVINRDSDYIDIEVNTANNTVQSGYYQGGLITLADSNLEEITARAFEINIDDDGYQQVTLPDSAFDSSVEALCAAIQSEIQGLEPLRARTPAAAFTAATCTLGSDGSQIRFTITSGTNAGVTAITDAGATARSLVRIRPASTNDVAATLGFKETDGAAYSDALAPRRPSVLTALQIGDHAQGGDVTDVQPGSDGSGELQASHFDTAFHLLDDISDVSLLAAPGIGTTWILDAGMSYCEGRPLRDIFYIGETGHVDDEPGEAEAFRKNLTKANSYGAVYYPWIRANDPSGQSTEPIDLPPSGYIAGIYARIDNNRGVWKSPAGTEASLNGAVGLTYTLSDTEQGNLNPINVNCIRRFDLFGLVSWGARTISSDPEWNYVPVRRTAIMLRKSIYNGIQWAVFEPNDERLWSSLRLNIGSFMNGLFRAGAFQGTKASDAYFVRCGLGDTMTQGDIDRGQVIVMVGFAPVKPAEFVIVRIQQKAGQQ